MIKLTIICLLLVNVKAQSEQLSVDEWKSFFTQKCQSVPARKLEYRCPTYAWNPATGCVPWNLRNCAYLSLKHNKYCVSLNCQAWLQTKDGSNFLSRTFGLPTSSTPAPTISSVSTVTTSPIKVTTAVPTTTEFEMEEEYCLEHYNCITKKYFSDSGCWRYKKSGHPDCHLFCSVENCKREHNPVPGICTAFNCSRKVNEQPIQTSLRPQIISTSTPKPQTISTSQTTKLPQTLDKEQPKFTLQDQYCEENYHCTIKRYFSDSGCWTYQQTSNLDCHLYCELETCKAIRNPLPGICTHYNCTRKLTPIIPIVPDVPIQPGTKVHYWMIGLLPSILVLITMLVIVVIWFRRRRNSTSEPNSNSSERGVNIPLLQQNQGQNDERPSFAEVFDLVEMVKHEAVEAAHDPGTSLAAASTPSAPSQNQTSEAASEEKELHKTMKKIWPEIILMADLEPKLPSLIVENSFQFEAALLVQICQIHLWASRRLHDSAFISLAEFGKTLKAVNADPTAETAKQQRIILNDRFQMALEKKLIWAKNLQCALAIFDKTVTNFAFMEACTDVLASNPDAANLVHTSGFGKNELSLEDRLNSTEFINTYKNTRSVKKLMDYYASNFAK